MNLFVQLIRFLMLCMGFPALVSCQSGKDVSALLTYLFTTESYNKKVRPLKDQTQAIEINVDFFLNSVIDFDEQEESLKISGFLSCNWVDEYLQWDNASYSNINELFIPQDDIWKPDISLRNTFKSFTGLGASYLNAYVTSNGAVEWNPYQVLESTCSVDITYFPFDTQICELKFTAWSYTRTHVDLDVGSRGVQLEEYVENSEWQLVQSSARETNSDEAAVFFTLKLKRRPNFYVLNIIVPVIFLSVLDIFSFLLPVSSGERASYTITVFLSMAVFLTIVAAALPQNSETTSLLSVYLMLMISLSTFIVVLSIAELRIASRDANTQPIGKGFMFFIKLSNLLTCKVCRKSVAPMRELSSKIKKRQFPDEKRNLPDEKVVWSEVVEAIDIVFFGVTFIYTVLITLIIGLVALYGDS